MLAVAAVLVAFHSAAFADPPTDTPTPPAAPKIDSGDTAWILVSTGLVLLMVPGLALFYGGMVRRKNILATMMQSMVALAVVGVYWLAVGYSLAFGNPWITGDKGSPLGWSDELFFLQGIEPAQILPG